MRTRKSHCPGWVTLALISSLFAQTNAPVAITDAKQITAKPDAEVEQGEQALSLQRLYNSREVGDTAWSPDGKSVVFVSNITGRNNLWLVSADGGWPSQLTVSEQRQAHPNWSPTGQWIAYQSDYDGDEQWDIFLVSPSSGEVVNLTHTREISEEDPTWSADGRYLAYVAKAKKAASFEIDVFDTLLRETKHLTSGTAPDKLNTNPIWSRDGAYIFFTQEQAKGTDSNIFVADRRSGTISLLTPHQGEHLYSAEDVSPTPSPDGGSLLVTSNASNGFDNVALLPYSDKGVRETGRLRPGPLKWLTREHWDIRGGSFSPDGRSVTWSVNADGNTDLYLHDLASARSTQLALPKGMNWLGGAENAFNGDGTRLLCYHSAANAPKEAWVYELRDGRATQLTHSLLAGISARHFVEPSLVRYPSRDGKWMISSLLYVPHNMQRNGQNAAIIYIHGGPASQSTNSFNRFIQHIVNQGYMLMAPNYRGSTGYGRDFQQANLFDMGGGDLDDVLAATDFLLKTGYPDAKKLIVMGGSYGGYLTMMAITKAPDLWSAGIAIVPFVNWFTEMAHEDPVLEQSDRATMGDPAKNPDFFRERSPLFFVDRIKAPLLLLAGAHDPRCPPEETTQVVEEINKRGGKVEQRIYADEGHGFARVENQIDAYQRITNFVKAHVPPADCGCKLN
ncbi:MAG: S9 family peptidase [Acidobacteria bacterium]|nr:S9 family peptidase [Acidobacteriota bacterium]